MEALTRHAADFAEKRRILQLETLYDLALALYADRPEGELVEELLQQVCAVLDPATAAAVTRDAFGSAQAVAAVGWSGSPPAGDALLSDPLWRDLLAQGAGLVRRDGEWMERAYRELIAAPLAYRGVYLGYIALLDKESRGDGEPAFSSADRRFLDSVAKCFVCQHAEESVLTVHHGQRVKAGPAGMSEYGPTVGRRLDADGRLVHPFCERGLRRCQR